MVPPPESMPDLAQSHAYARGVATPLGDLSVLGSMLAIWHLRPAIQRRFPLSRGRSRDWLRFLSWCATDGRREYAILRESRLWNEELSRPLALPQLANDRWQGAHSLASTLHGIALHRWGLSGMLGNAAARNRAARHFWRGARHGIQTPPIATWQRKALDEAFGNPVGVARFIAMKKHASACDSELIRQYGLEDLNVSSAATDDTSATSLTLPEDLQCSPVPLPQPLMRLIEPILQRTRKGPTHADSVRVMKRLETAPCAARISHYRFGVNLIGYARGELGIGEDIRQVAVALQAQGIPVCILNFQPGSNISQADRSADSLIVTEPRYGINIFCMTGIETTRYVCEKGLSALDGRYNIGLWPWELPDWPESCRHAYACVDEIWGISEYTARAHRHAAPRPVMPMSLPVELGAVGEQTRSDFGLPENPFLFYFAFDINSNAARKNPEGLIEAFQKAFPTENQDQVGLVLKISHPETSCKLWAKIRKIAKRDKRIRVVEKTLRRPELLALFKACDCLVSLHRAEGFGRCIAEALLLDKQVIATGFSGNLDFCHEPRVALVRHGMSALTAKDYMWGEGQSWAEPDLDHAAELMQSIWKNPRETRHRDFDFSPSTVGRRYSARLEEIWKIHAADPKERRLQSAWIEPRRP